jgi:hypothetical protein
MERIILLSIAILLFAAITKAQITKGSTFIGGQISFSKSKTKSDTNAQEGSSFSFSPAIGIAIKQNLVAGIDLNYGHSEYDNGMSPVQKNNNYGGGFFLRRYVPISNRFLFFAQGRAGYGHSKAENNSNTYQSSSESNGASLSFYPGVSFALSKVLYIETGFDNLAVLSYSYGTSKQTGSPDQTSNNFAFSTGVTGTNLSFALRFIIPKK